MANSGLNKTSVLYLTNNSGGDVAQGDVVIVDTSNPVSFTTTSTVGYAAGVIGVVIDPNGILNGAIGAVAFGGYVPKINLSGSASIHDTVYASATPKQADPHSTVQSGDFGQVLVTGTSPEAMLWGMPIQSLGSASYPYILIKELLGAGVDAGAPVSGVLAVRNINTVVVDTDSLVISLAASVLTLTAGTYRINAIVPSYNSGGSQAFLWGVIANSPIVIGTTDYGGVNVDVTFHNRIVGQFVWPNTDTLTIEQMFPGLSPDAAGLGKAVNVGYGECYTIVELWKVG